MYKSLIQGLLGIRHFRTANMFMPAFWNQPEPASCQSLTLDGRRNAGAKDNVNSSACKVFNERLYYLHPAAGFLCEAGLTRRMSCWVSDTNKESVKVLIYINKATLVSY